MSKIEECIRKICEIADSDLVFNQKIEDCKNIIDDFFKKLKEWELEERKSGDDTIDKLKDRFFEKASEEGHSDRAEIFDQLIGYIRERRQTRIAPQ